MIYKHLESKYINDPSIMVIRFRFQYSKTKNIDFAQLRKYILQQLVFHRALATTMEKLLPYHLKHSSQPPEDDLKILIAELGTYTRVFLILDALDEAPGAMGMLIRTTLLSQLPSNVRAICTSRKLDDIIVSFDKDRAFDIATHNRDVRMYIDKFLDEAPPLRNLIQRSNINELAEQVVKESEGM